MFVKATPSIVLASFLVGIILGVTLSSWLASTVLVLGIMAVIGCGYSLLRRASLNDRLLLIGLLLVGIGLGVWRYAAVQPDANSVANLTGESQAVTATIVKLEHSVLSQKLTLAKVNVNGTYASGRVLVYAPGYPKLKTGQIISFNCSSKPTI